MSLPAVEVVLLLVIAPREAIISLLSDSLKAERAALVELFNSTGGPFTWSIGKRWNVSDVTDSSHCTWSGITCSSIEPMSVVTELILPQYGMSGQLPWGVFSRLTFLKTLNVSYNALTGPIPLDIQNCTSMNTFAVMNNTLNGTLPPNCALGWSYKSLISFTTHSLGSSLPTMRHGLTFDTLMWRTTT